MRVRLLHVVRSLRRETGGIAEAVRQLAAAQRGRGHAVSVVSLDPRDASDASVIMLGRTSDGYGRAPSYDSWLREHRGEFDAVIVHGLWQYQSFATWRTLRGTATPFLIYPHGMLDVWFKRAHPLKHAKKWLYWPWADYRVLRDAAAVCYTADEERRRARLSFWLYRACERIAPIGIAEPSGSEAQQREAFFACHPRLRGRSFVLFLGRIHPKKGVDLLLQAHAGTGAAPDRPLDLVIAGPGLESAYGKRLQAMASALGIASTVHWLPMLSGDEKWGALRGCEAFALFSHQENFGVAVVEALACGRPVLLSDQIAIAGEIAHDGAGFVAAAELGAAIAVMRRWRAVPPEQRRTMSEAARVCFTRRFEIGRAAEHLDAVIAAVMARR